MALNSDTLGEARFAASKPFNDKTYDELIATYGTLDGVRLAALKADSKAIIDHFIANAEVLPTTLVAPEHAGPVTGKGTIQ